MTRGLLPKKRGRKAKDTVSAESAQRTRFVATVAIGGGLNAGLLAAQILAVEGGALADRLEIYRQTLHDTVVTKDARLMQLGSQDYLDQMS